MWCPHLEFLAAFPSGCFVVALRQAAFLLSSFFCFFFVCVVVVRLFFVAVVLLCFVVGPVVLPCGLSMERGSGGGVGVGLRAAASRGHGAVWRKRLRTEKGQTSIFMISGHFSRGHKHRHAVPVGSVPHGGRLSHAASGDGAGLGAFGVAAVVSAGAGFEAGADLSAIP